MSLFTLLLRLDGPIMASRISALTLTFAGLSIRLEFLHAEMQSNIYQFSVRGPFTTV